MMLEIPRTISELIESEYTSNPAILEEIRARRLAEIVEGYKFLINDRKDGLPFDFYAKININNSCL